MAAQRIKVTGYRELVRACQRADRDTKKYMRQAFKETGDIVKDAAASKFGRYDTHTARGYRTYVRQRGVGVEQSLRKTTGLRPDFGGLQMRRALEPALDEHRAQVEREFEKAIDKVCDRFERMP